MDREAALRAYIQAILPEREDYLYQRALNKVRGITRGMSAEEAEAYYRGKAFGNALYHVRKGDEVYQALLRGELGQERYAAEFERLAPMIAQELQAGNPVDLAFLRSVERSRVNLKKARTVLRLVKQRAPGRLLEGQVKRLADQSSDRVERYLLKADLSRMVTDPGVADVVPWLMDTAFKKGLSVDVLERAWRPKSLTGALRGALYRDHPELAACGQLRLPDGGTVSEALKRDIQQAKAAICARMRQRWPRERIQRLLSANPSVRQLQRQADATFGKAKKLRSALLNAVPEHYRDLYPLARQMRRKFILHLGPTNSGKTYEGVERLRYARNGIYLGPLRLLAAEQFETLNRDGTPCSLVTGEEQIRVPGSRVQSSTVEMADLKARYDVAVIDECQMIADRDRGGAWTAAILGLCADEIHACASPDAEGLLKRIIEECGDELEIVRHRRMVPLVAEKEGFRFPASVRKGDALIVFSKARVHAVAAELKRQGWRVSLIYGALPPDVRRDQAERFHEGDSQVVVSTDAIAMGMNLPIQRVVFLESEKFDGDITRPLTDAEIKQIAGRAGRYGQYDVGYVNAYGFKGIVAQALNKPLYALTEAVISFPESLLGLPLPLSQIINQWLAMKDKSCFSKASTERMAALAAMMETPKTDKALLYRFLCIPFDEEDPDLLNRWKAMYRAECNREHIEVESELPWPPEPEDCTTAMLDGLEADYRRCDLYYNYARLFLEDPDDVLEEIQRRKGLISEGIIHILSTQKLQQRTCPSCKAPLPWNWPYRVCDVCHERQRGRRRGNGE
ncbi:MAG: helicase [Clostridia bacterium]|nr:helicase [Clostridia bacterium]